MKPSKPESIRDAITKAIDNQEIAFALDLIEYWDSKFPLGEEARTLFYYTKLQVLLKGYESTENIDVKVEYLSKAIETGNKFFAANEQEGFPMDSEVQLMWFNLVDHSAEIVAFYSEDTYDDDDDDWDEDNDSNDDYRTDIFSEAIYARIGRINQPNLKPKPPRKYDDSIRSRLLKATHRYIEEVGDLESNEFKLLENICKELDIIFDDFYNEIYDY
ncbi:MAG: hypothetical protein K2I92_01345 [Muribaculaceae bacterium]|nr:hypothetical protein [Muribaculaceae bacterium]